MVLPLGATIPSSQRRPRRRKRGIAVAGREQPPSRRGNRRHEGLRDSPVGRREGTRMRRPGTPRRVPSPIPAASAARPENPRTAARRVMTKKTTAMMKKTTAQCNMDITSTTATAAGVPSAWANLSEARATTALLTRRGTRLATTPGTCGADQRSPRVPRRQVLVRRNQRPVSPTPSTCLEALQGPDTGRPRSGHRLRVASPGAVRRESTPPKGSCRHSLVLGRRHGSCS